jgi:hypothetical protein
VWRTSGHTHQASRHQILKSPAGRERFKKTSKV